MTLDEIVKQFRSGTISKLQVSTALAKSVEPLFQIAEIMSDLDMTWTIVKGEIISTLTIPFSSLQEQAALDFLLDPKDLVQISYGYLLSGNIYEPDVFSAFCHLIKKDGVFVDVGANVGYYSILAAKAGAIVYAFEPIPATYQRLRRNIELNKLTNVKALCMGLGEKTAFEIFYYDEKIPDASSRINLDYYADGAAVQIECPVVTLDEICAQEKIERIDLIKCDVEGGELFVFRGGVQTLKKYRPYVLCEMLRKWSAKFHYHPNEIIQLFSSLGYVCIALPKLNTRGYVLERMLETTEETNFLFIPGEKVPELRFLLKE